MPSSDSWFDNCNNASASVKCTLEDVNKLDAGEAESEEELLFVFDVTLLKLTDPLLPVPEGGTTVTIVGVEAQELPNEDTPLVEEGDTDLSKLIADMELVPKWGKTIVEPIDELDIMDAEEDDIEDDVGEAAHFPV